MRLFTVAVLIGVFISQLRGISATEKQARINKKLIF
jgi:hypothetical protein